MQQGPVAKKKDVALFLLESSLVQFHLDPRKEGVALPDYLRKQPQVALDIGLNTPVPIPDLDVGEVGITCTLSFNRTPFPCVLPWTAIFAMVTRDGKAAVWPEDVPPESPLAKELKEPPRPRLSAVPNPPPEPPTQLDEEREKRTAKGGKKPSKAGKKTSAKTARPDSPVSEGTLEKVADKGKKRAAKNPKKEESASVATRPAIVPIARPMRVAAEEAQAESPPAKPQAAPAAASTTEPLDEAPRGAPKPQTSQGKAKVKREIPSYLRVVK